MLPITVVTIKSSHNHKASSCLLYVEPTKRRHGIAKRQYSNTVSGVQYKELFMDERRGGGRKKFTSH